MTLILSCLTKDCVYQISDRRLTNPNPPRKIIDDETNKVVFINGRTIFGYTGISEINHEKTDIWLTRVAASQNTMDLGKISSHIKETATTDFKLMQMASRYKRHAFQGVGWFNEKGILLPGIVTIQNAIDPITEEWLPYSRPEFDLDFQTFNLRKSELYINSVGLRPHAHERSAVCQLLRKCVHRKVRRQEAIMTAMILAMRWLHDRYEPNSPIGPNLMAVSIPRVVAERVQQTGTYMSIAGGPQSDVASFLDVNISGRAHVFGPNHVFGGNATSGFRAGPIEKNNV